MSESKVKEKNQEQLNKERAERFAKDPDSFMEVSEVICAVIKSEKGSLGISILINECKRSILDICQMELEHRFDLCRRQMDITSEMKVQMPGGGGIIPGNGRNFSGLRIPK